MNKQELITAISEQAGLDAGRLPGLEDAGKALEALTGAIADAMKKGDKVQLVGFGTFETVKKAAREGKNPATGEKIKIPACVAPKFKAGKALKDLVNS